MSWPSKMPHKIAASDTDYCKYRTILNTASKYTPECYNPLTVEISKTRQTDVCKYRIQKAISHFQVFFVWPIRELIENAHTHTHSFITFWWECVLCSRVMLLLQWSRSFFAFVTPLAASADFGPIQCGPLLPNATGCFHTPICLGSGPPFPILLTE